MTTSFNRSRFAMMTAMVAAIFALVLAKPASAQHPTSNTWTAAGTKIKNKATASYTDARGNTYADVADSVEVTVGFRGSIAVTRGTASATFDANTTGNTVDFTVTNYGNGVDSVNFSLANTSSFTGLQYCVGTDCFSSAAGIDTIQIASGGSITVTIKFNVPAGAGGDTASFKLSGDSKRDATDTADSDLTSLDVRLNGSVAVTGGSASVVPTNYNGTTRMYYSASFKVTNSQTGSATYNLSQSVSGDADVSSIRITDCSGNTITSLTIGYNTFKNACVEYNVASGADAGDAATISLTATASNDNTISDGNDYSVTVIKAALSISKKAYLANGTTEITTETPKPGDTIWYKITVSNASGAAQASSVVIDDDLPTQITFDSSDSAATNADGGTPAWDFTGTTDTHVKATITTLAANASRSFMIKVVIK